MFFVFIHPPPPINEDRTTLEVEVDHSPPCPSLYHPMLILFGNLVTHTWVVIVDMFSYDIISNKRICTQTCELGKGRPFQGFCKIKKMTEAGTRQLKIKPTIESPVLDKWLYNEYTDQILTKFPKILITCNGVDLHKNNQS